MFREPGWMTSKITATVFHDSLGLRRERGEGEESQGL
jgi:hypothetical protein